MFRNYFKIAVRYLVKHKGYTFINILGLAVGIACCILVMLFVKSEWSFDRFHTKSDRLYRGWLEEHYEGQIFTNTVTPIPLVPVLQAGIPEIEGSCRVTAFNAMVNSRNHTYSDPVNMVDSNFFQLFDFPLKEGSVRNAFATPNSVVITEDAAKKYFGSETAIGKNLGLQLGNDTVLFTVTAVARNIPYSSSIQFDLLIPFSHAPHLFSEGARTRGWSNVAVESYFLLKQGASLSSVHNKIVGVMNPQVARRYQPGEYIIRLQPMTDIHLNNGLPAGNQPVSDPKYAYILATVGLLILLIACVNFITLSVGRSTTRALEVGVRKVLGAERRELIRQFWGEAILVTLVSLVVGILLARLMQNPFSQLANRTLHLSVDPFTVLFCLALAVIIGLLSGIYPAVILSGFKPIQVLKGRLSAGSMGFFRKALVIGQFAASIIMIIATITVGRQLQYLQNKDLGYNREHVIIVPTNKARTEGNPLGQRFKLELEKNPDVLQATVSLYSMAENGWMNLGYKDDKDVFRQFRFNAVDADFLSTMGLQVTRGRAFSRDNPADSNGILVNEALVKEYGWKDPIGQKLPGKYDERVLGVLKDFHFESLHTPIRPVVIGLRPDSIFRRSTDVSFAFPPQPRISVRFRAGNLQAHIEQLKTSWKSVAGDQDFEYGFLDEALNNAYQQEQRLGRIVRYASFLSIFIACMGLFGLATLVVARRTKEIGIRKVLGADISRIVVLLSREFILLVVLASLLAFPLAWWGLSKWLEDFAYRVPVPWWAFAGAVLLSLAVALATVSIQAIQAALANPVKSLRTE